MQYANMRNAYHNQQLWAFDGVGELEVPPLPSVNVPLNDSKFIRFDFTLKETHPEDKIVHFFTDDYIFERVWRNPERYVPLLSKFRAVIAPDFSLYTDHPRICQMYNHFKKHWCGAYWSGMGITVIPSPSWVLGDDSCFKWCLDGEPEHSTICISSHGAIKGDKRKRDFERGWNTVMDRLKPERVYLFGYYPESLHLEVPCDLIHVENEIMVARRKYCRRTVDGEGQ